MLLHVRLPNKQFHLGRTYITVTRISAFSDTACYGLLLHFAGLRRYLQNALCDFVNVRIKAKVRFRSEICKLRMHDFEIVQRILQVNCAD